MDYRYETERLRSFDNWIPTFAPYGVTPESLAANGFYHTGFDERVRCFSCEMEIGYWLEGDTPFSLHQLWRPHCRFLRNLPCGNVPLFGAPMARPPTPRYLPSDTEDLWRPYQNIEPETSQTELTPQTPTSLMLNPNQPIGTSTDSSLMVAGIFPPQDDLQDVTNHALISAAINNPALYIDELPMLSPAEATARVDEEPDENQNQNAKSVWSKIFKSFFSPAVT